MGCFCSKCLCNLCESPATTYNDDNNEQIQTQPVIQNINQNNPISTKQLCQSSTQNKITSTKEPMWKDYEELAKIIKVNEYTAKNIIKLFSEGNTIPFIARYRTGMTGNLNAEKLREAKKILDELNLVKKKLQSVISSLSAFEDLDEVTLNSLLKCKTLDEINYIVRI